jgi:N-formylmaleamate deformylase
MEYKQDFATIDGVKIHYYRAGTGNTTIMLLHGATDNGACWKPLADRLAGEYEVVMPDAQGHGLSDRLSPGFDFLDHARQVAGLAGELGIEKPVLIGHSMGGSTATNTAALFPDLPKVVVFEDPGWGVPPPQRSEGQTAPNEFVRRFEKQSKMSVEQLVEQCRKENPSWSDEEITPWAESKKQFDMNLFSVMQIGRPSYRETVPKITCPGLLFTSENGIVSDKVAVEAMELWTADKPLRHNKIMGAGHNIRREQFDAFYDSLVSFLREL